MKLLILFGVLAFVAFEVIHSKPVAEEAKKDETTLPVTVTEGAARAAVVASDKAASVSTSSSQTLATVKDAAVKAAAK